MLGTDLQEVLCRGKEYIPDARAASYEANGMFRKRETAGALKRSTDLGDSSYHPEAQ